MSESSDVIQYFGIKKPDGRIWWIADSKQNSWLAFFYDAPHRLPLDEAIQAYKAIGYRCVEVEVKEKERHEPAEATVTVYLYKSQEGEVFATTVVMSDKTILAGLAELIGNKEVTVREGDGMESSCPAISASR